MGEVIFTMTTVICEIMSCMRFIDVLFRYAVHSSDDIGAPWTFFEINQQKGKI